MPIGVADEEVYEHFAACGEIESVRIIRDAATQVGKGFGFVRFKVRAAGAVWVL